MKITELRPEEQEAKRAKWRDAQQKSRNKKRSDNIDPVEAEEIARETAIRASRNLHFVGESLSGQNAKTVADELQIHREFLRALGRPDVQPGETLRAVAHRTFDAWLAGPYAFKDYVPGFNRAVQQFDPDFGFEIIRKPFEEIWVSPEDGTEQPIDIASLPDLPKLPKPKLAKPESKTPEPGVPTTPELLERGRVQLLNQLRTDCDPKLSSDARRYLNGV
jgi:hypothetical protein